MPDLETSSPADPNARRRPERAITLVASGCLGVLVLVLFSDVLFRNRQFAYRDASQFYYPLYQRVQEEWAAGRWPLWMPEVNCGMPLLGNPIAAVFYPGKVIYSLLPYPWAARIYVIAHVLLAFGTMVALLRSWGVSVTGSALGGLSYAFAGPVLFQYANVIFLVGAAWMPLGLRAVDRWLSQGKRLALIELALVLSMQVLGGDLQSAYLLGAIAALYGVWLFQPRPAAARWALLLGLVVVFYGLQLWLAGRIEASLRADTAAGENAAGWYRMAARCVTLTAWALALVILVRRWWPTTRGLAGLAGAGVLGLALTAVQLWPVIEFAGQSDRVAASLSMDIYAYSLRPFRALEWLWPNVSGTLDRGNRYWIETYPRRHSEDFWVPSVYVGGFTLVLACGSAGFFHGSPRRSLLTAMVVVGVLGSLGEYTSPRFWTGRARQSDDRTAAADPASAPASVTFVDPHGGDGGFYWLLAVIFPGMETFRYPSKLLTIVCLGLAGLAGMGWDQAVQGKARRAWWCAVLGLLATLGAILFLLAGSGTLRVYLADPKWFRASAFGPLDVTGVVNELRLTAVQALIVSSSSLGLLSLAPRRLRTEGAVAIFIVSLDLMAAGSRIVWTVPQAVYEEPPRMLKVIEAAERSEPAPGPFRIHRMNLWQPVDWFLRASHNRHEEIAQWQNDTLGSLYPISFGLDSTYLLGPSDVYDHALLFMPGLRTADPQIARTAKLEPGERYMYYPRQSFDVWNTRYFIVPARLLATDMYRGFVSFLPQTKILYPDMRSFEGAGADERREHWYFADDVSLLRNKAAFPRAWVVHRARFVRPIVSKSKAERKPLFRRLTAPTDEATSETDRSAYDLRTMAWIETDHPGQLARFTAGGEPGPAESVVVLKVDPEHIELAADLRAPGVIVLAETYYPGWELSIDGQPAPILRVNRMMRGASVEAGSHRLVYSYRPHSFRLGMMVSLAALAVVALLGVWAAFSRLLR
jgi:hypothetical protein